MTTIKQIEIETQGIIRAIVETNPASFDIYKNIAVLIDDTLKQSYGRRILFDENTDNNVSKISTYLLSAYYTWNTIIKSTEFEYNPIDNYNGKETETITITRQGQDTNNITQNLGERNDTASGTENTNGTNSGKNNNIESVAPYNTSVVDRSANNGTSLNTIQNTVDSSSNQKIGAQSNQIDSVLHRDTTDTHTRIFERAGNMGTTTTQSMIREEREIANINVVRQIAHEIANLISYGVYCFVDETEGDYIWW